MLLSCSEKVVSTTQRNNIKNVGDSYCLNCFHSYSTENETCYDCCQVKMPKEDNKILKYNHGEMSMKVSFIIYADLQSLLGKITLTIIILRNHQELKQINIHPLVIHCLKIVHLIQQKISLIVIKVKNVWKNFVKI